MANTTAFILTLALGAASACTAFASEGIKKFASCGAGGFLEGAVLDRQGQLWAVDLMKQTIVKISQDDCAVAAQLQQRPNGAKFRADGVMVLTTHEGLYSFDPADGTVALIADEAQGEKLTGLNDLSFDREGGLYFTAPNRSDLFNPLGRIYYLPSESSEPEVLAEGIAFPNGIAVHPNGRVVIASEFAAKRLLSLPAKTAKGGFPLNHVFAHTSGGVGADGLSFDQEGRLYAANIEAGHVSIYSASNDLAGVLRLPAEAGPLVTNIAIAADGIYITEAAKGEVWYADNASIATALAK